MTVSFIIDEAGDVQNAAVSATTLSDPQTESCLRRVVRTMRFGRQPQGGIVGVNYPFVFDLDPPRAP